MKKILLVCSGGMSTSLLSNRMQEAAEEMQVDVEIMAAAEPDARKLMDQVDVVMLGPQVSFVFDEFKELAITLNTSVIQIDTRDYGRMDGEKVLQIALTELNKNVQGEAL